MEGRRPVDVLQGDETDQAEVGSFRVKLSQGKPFNTQLIHYRKSGERFWISMNITPVYSEAGEIM